MSKNHKPEISCSLDRSFSETLDGEPRTQSIPNSCATIVDTSERDFVFMVATLINSFYNDEADEDMKDGMACINEVAEWMRSVKKGGEGE